MAYPQTVATGYHPKGDGHPAPIDFSRYQLWIIRKESAEKPWEYVETRDFPNKVAAMEYCRTIGAVFQVN